MIWAHLQHFPSSNQIPIPDSHFTKYGPYFECTFIMTFWFAGQNDN